VAAAPTTGMTKDVNTRKKHTGEPGNGGQFGAQTKPEAGTSLGYLITRKTSSTMDALPADLHQKLDDAVTAAFPDSEPILFSPVNGFQDGYIDLIAYDSEDGRSVKFTMDLDGEITSY
jgi:hypothetical protein